MTINVCAVFRRGVHIAQTQGARRGHWPDRVAQSGGLLTFYDPTPLSARFSSKTSKGLVINDVITGGGGGG